MLDRTIEWMRRALRPGGLAPGGGATPRADPARFRAFLGSRAAFIAQKTVLDYCGVKFGVQWQAVQANLDFAAALGHCRWAVFWPAASDLTLAAGRWLLPHAPSARALGQALGAAGEAVLAEAGWPGDPATLADAQASLRARLALLSEEPQVGPATMVLAAAGPLLETIPIHPDQRKDERVAILGGLRMNLIAVCQDMERMFDAPGLAAALLAATRADLVPAQMTAESSRPGSA